MVATTETDHSIKGERSRSYDATKSAMAARRHKIHQCSDWQAHAQNLQNSHRNRQHRHCNRKIVSTAVEVARANGRGTLTWFQGGGKMTRPGRSRSSPHACNRS